MSAVFLIFTTIVWYEFLTSMSAFEILMLVRIFTVLVGIACMVLYFLKDSIQIVVVEEEGDVGELEEVLAKDSVPVPAKEESEEFADLLGTPSRT